MLQDIQMWMLQYKRAEPAALIESASITLLTARFIYFNNKAEVGLGLSFEKASLLHVARYVSSGTAGYWLG